MYSTKSDEKIIAIENPSQIYKSQNHYMPEEYIGFSSSQPGTKKPFCYYQKEDSITQTLHNISQDLVSHSNQSNDSIFEYTEILFQFSEEEEEEEEEAASGVENEFSNAEEDSSNVSNDDDQNGQEQEEENAIQEEEEEVGNAEDQKYRRSYCGF